GGGQFQYSGKAAQARRMMANITAWTAREVGLLELKNGKQVIRIAARETPRRIFVRDVADIISHTHVSGWLVPSGNVVTGVPGDLVQWGIRDQVRAYLVAPNGCSVLWTSASGHWTLDIAASIVQGLFP